MGFSNDATSSQRSHLSQDSNTDNVALSGVHEKHQRDLENLTLITQPFNTLKFFILAIIQYLKRVVLYLFGHRACLMLLSVFLVLGWLVLKNINGPHEKHFEELLRYQEFGLWWVALGVASSIGLGSGLHTFVLYLGPHIAFFTIKAMQCGRVDIKSAPYDTIQLKRVPSWLGKDCSEFGPPVFTSSHGSRVPLRASLSGEKMDMEELDTSSSKDEGHIATLLNKFKRWFLSHAQYLNFFTILLLASVPNPLFDLAGIMCGQFGIPFWEFFLATMIGKAIVKTHIQTVFIILVCNNQLLNWIENELIWVLSHIPGFDSILPDLVTKLHAVKEMYMKPPAPVTTNSKVNSWDLSFASIWNAVVWMMLINFLVKIVTSTAQRYLKKQQEEELAMSNNTTDH